MPFFQDANHINIDHSTFIDIGGDQVVINNKHNLSYADGASWNGTQVCLPGTRVQLLEDIMHHVTTTDVKEGGEIVLLEDVAGSGKTAVAHTISQRCYAMGLLASSFFFDRETSGRNGPEKLFSTIALDLAGLSRNLAQAIDLVLEQQRSLPSAALSRQFEELILKPFQRHPIDRPVVVVIDALDESYSSEPNIELLTILRDYVPKLPGTFRMFVTTRPLKEIGKFLAKQRHVCRLTIDISHEANREDIAIYVKSQLKEVAEWGELGDDWPDTQLLSGFTRMAEGLFLWVSTVCKYIQNTIDPDGELRSLISRCSPQRMPAEDKMDKLYVTILESCNWNDEKFVDGYKVIMGAIMAAKIPLSTRALHGLHNTILATRYSTQSHVTENAMPRPDVTSRSWSQLSPEQQIFYRSAPPLHIVRTQSDACTPLASCHNRQTISTVTHCSSPTVPVSAVLRPLGSLLTGISDTEQPVRILHLSFRDFVTVRAQLSPASERFYLSEKEHSQRLAHLCLFILNENLRQGMPGTGYLESLTPGIPEIAEGQISEEVWYACRFWLDHIIDVEPPVSVKFITALWNLLSTKIVLWIEIVASKGKFQNPRRVQEWVQRTLPDEAALINTVFNLDLASSLFALSDRLKYMSREEEALDVAQEVVKIRRKLVMEYPIVFDSDLVDSLNDLSVYLSDMGHRDEALETIQEAVEIGKKLATKYPANFNPNLARCFYSLARRLLHLCREDEALDAIHQAVDIRRKLAAEHPAVYNPVLARSLVSLSECLLRTRRDGAFGTIQEATEILQKLAAEQPAAFNSAFAFSLYHLSQCLCDLGRSDKALHAIQKAVAIRQKLAIERPAAFNSDLAFSLHRLSQCLHNLGRRDEALDAIQQAVAIRQKLAIERPAAFNPDLAFSLHHLSRCLHDLGRRDEALDAIQQAVAIWKKLAIERPAAFNSDFAFSLHYLSQCLHDLGRRDEALDAIQQAVTIRQKLATERPAAFNFHFAFSLHHLSRCLHDLGRRDEALDAIQQALAIWQKLATERPAAFNFYFVFSLHHLSRCLHDLGRRDKALDAIQQAVTIQQNLAIDHPAEFNPNFAYSLHDLAILLSDMDRQEEALEAIQKAVQIQRGLAMQYPLAFGHTLVNSLQLLSRILFCLGKEVDAMDAMGEANTLVLS